MKSAFSQAVVTNVILMLVSARTATPRTVPSRMSSVEADPGHYQISFGSCGLLTRQGLIWQESFEDGSSVEIRCSPFGASRLPSYTFWYVGSSGARYFAGRCIFSGGCNAAELYGPPSQAHNGRKPKSVVRLVWQTVDGWNNDGEKTIIGDHTTGSAEPFLDVVTWDLDTQQNLLTWQTDKYWYRVNPHLLWITRIRCHTLVQRISAADLKTSATNCIRVTAWQGSMRQRGQLRGATTKIFP